MKTFPENNRINNPDFDDIVFDLRNKEYGAYKLRKNYKKNVVFSLLIGTLILTGSVIPSYLYARKTGKRIRQTEREVEIKMDNLDQPAETVVPPPPPPPPPADIVEQVKYIAPVVVDSINKNETVNLMTADEAQSKVQNSSVTEIPQETVREEIKEDAEQEPFLMVQEMPEPPGGVEGLLKYIADNSVYPAIAKDNNIEGKVFVRFCVTAKGTIDKISIFKGVDPSLDAEALRVVKTLPSFKPGRQAGKPVPVWFVAYIDFKLK